MRLVPFFACALALSLAMPAGDAQAQVLTAPSNAEVKPSGAGSSNSQDGKPLPQAPVPAAGDPLYAPIAFGGPQTLSQKFHAFAVNTVGPRALVAPAFTAGFEMLNPPNRYPREWRQGAEAFGRNYGNVIASDGALETARFATGAILHEDFRYQPSSSKNPFGRTVHAIGFTFVDRSDSGRPRLALANFAGAGAGGYVGRLYLPKGYDDISHADTRVGIRLGGLAASNVLREFSPDLAHALKRAHLPFPRIPVPEWWTPDHDPHP